MHDSTSSCIVLLARKVSSRGFGHLLVMVIEGVRLIATNDNGKACACHFILLEFDGFSSPVA